MEHTALKTSINELNLQVTGKTVWVAYSGGVDSHVLLHLLAASNSPVNKIHAIHIDHCLHDESSLWTQHCEKVATDLGVELTSIQVQVTDIDEMGLEAAAREARYTAFEQHLTENDVLLTAQHQQDQAETLLLQLFRGAGPKGLASMAKQFQIGNVSICRPLLNIKKRDILSYAQQHNLQWIEDPSNIETRWNRNYIRHKVLPEIESRWPSVAKTISRSAENCAEASELLVELAEQDLMLLTDRVQADYLHIPKLLSLSPARCRNILRYYIEQKELPLPSSSVLQHVIDEVCLAKQDSVPLIRYANVEIRRFQDKLYIMSPLPKHKIALEMRCANIADLHINEYTTLSWQKKQGQGLKEELINAGLAVRFRQGGEKILLPNQTHHKSLKHLFQEWGVPPWQRERIPLIFYGDSLIAVTDYVVDNKHCVSEGEQGYFPILKSSY